MSTVAGRFSGWCILGHYSFTVLVDFESGLIQMFTEVTFRLNHALNKPIQQEEVFF